MTMDGGLRSPSHNKLAIWLGKHRSLLSGLATAAVLLTLFADGRHFLADTLPYVQHIDERTLMRGARRVVQEDGLNPRIYSYPSLPFYLVAAGVAWGAIQSSAHGPDRVLVKSLGRLEPPYYERVRVGAAPRTLWILLAVGSVAAASSCAYALAGSGVALLSSMILGLAGVPTLNARGYLSVDLPLTLFCSLLFAHLACAFGSTGYRERVLMPALLCGAAIACKYTGAVALLPALLAIWLTPGSSRFARSVELLLLSGLVFVVLCPRFVLDLPRFVDGISTESHHYGFRGHKRFTVDPGSRQLWAYLRDSADAFGWTLVFVSGVGVVTHLRRTPRLAAVLLSFPCAWMLMLCSARVHFPRNLLPVMILLGVYVSLGIGQLWSLSGALGRRIRAARGALVARTIFVVLIAATVPWQRTLERHQYEVDSRVRVARWTTLKLREDASLIIPSAIAFADETLPPNLRVQRVDLRDATATADAAQPGAYMLVPNWTTASGGVASRVAELSPGMNALPKHQLIREFPGAAATPFLESELSINPSLRLVRFE